MIKKLIKYTISAAILTTMFQATPTFASPEVTKEQIDATKVQIDDFETKMQQLENRISMSLEKSQELTDSIKTQQGKIEETETEIENAKKSLDTHKQVYSERLKSIQLEGKQSVTAYAELLLSSDNISEFLTRFTAISKIMESDTDLLNGLNEKEKALKDAEEKLHTELHQLEVSQAELASEQKQIEADKQEVAQALAAAENNLQNQQAQLAEQEAQKQALLAEQEAQRQAQLAAQQQAQQQAAQQQAAQQQTQVNNAPKSTPSVDTTVNVTNTGDVNALIAYAKQFLGVPYVWGGSTPNGFDCSGFTSYVFRNAAGINLPRVSRDQQNFGTRISPSEVQPGDLVFRGNPAYHVGIYIGNGQYIHAPQTGDVVKIATYNASKFSSAARVLH